MAEQIDDTMIRQRGAPAAPAQPPLEPEPEAEAPAPAEGGDTSGLASLKLPEMQAVLAGSPAAVSTPVATKNPDVATVWEERDKLGKLGIGFYKSLAGDTGVIFNSMYVRPEDLDAADKAGQLQQLAPPMEVVRTAVVSGGAENHPALTAQPPPAPPAGSPPAPRQTASGVLTPTPPKSTLRRLHSERVKALEPGGPTSGMRPGAGRILNMLTRQNV